MLLRNRIARGFAAGALVLALPTLAACGDFATDKIYTPAPGANDRTGEVDVLNAIIVATQDGHGTFLASFSNNRDSNVANGFEEASDRLVSIEGDFTATMPGAKGSTSDDNDARQAEEQADAEGTDAQDAADTQQPADAEGAADKATPATEPVTLGPSGKYVMGTEGDGPGIPVDGEFQIGDFVEVTLTFEHADDVVVTVPVVCAANHWEGQDTNPANVDAEPSPQCVGIGDGDQAEGGH